ncbi:hypothetical protein DUNSADRAFT_157, partial [Dunaliella salina]
SRAEARDASVALANASAPPLPLTPPPPLPPNTPALSAAKAHPPAVPAAGANRSTEETATCAEMPTRTGPSTLLQAAAASQIVDPIPAACQGQASSTAPAAIQAQPPRRSARLRAAMHPPTAPAPGGANSKSVGVRSNSRGALTAEARTNSRGSKSGARSGSTQSAATSHAQ